MLLNHQKKTKNIKHKTHKNINIKITIKHFLLAYTIYMLDMNDTL